MPPATELATIEQRLLEIFERHRRTPGAPYDAAHFLDFLLAAPKRKSAVHDSFQGKARFNRFVDDVQLEFRVCLANADLERVWTPSTLAERILHKQGNPKADLRLVGDRMTRERSALLMPMLLVNLLLGAPGLGLAIGTRSWIVGSAVVAALALLDAGLLALHRRAIRRWQRLEAALRAACAPEA